VEGEAGDEGDLVSKREPQSSSLASGSQAKAPVSARSFTPAAACADTGPGEVVEQHARLTRHVALADEAALVSERDREALVEPERRPARLTVDLGRLSRRCPSGAPIPVSGAKNAALPILCATLLSDGESLLRNVPKLRDIDTTAALLRFLGRGVHGRRARSCAWPRLRRAPRGPVRAREADARERARARPAARAHGRAKVSLPGGCQIGTRPIDQHLKGLEALGATIELERGYIVAECKRLRGAEVVFDMPTVTGTENLMMAAASRRAARTLVNARASPRSRSSAACSTRWARASTARAPTSSTSRAPTSSSPFDHAIVPDRIEAGTYMVAAAAAGGDVLLEGAPLEDLEATRRQAARGRRRDRPRGHGRPRAPRRRAAAPVDIATAPHPGFPTDMQAQFMVLMCLAEGTSRIVETIFENRFMHVPELRRMGATSTSTATRRTSRAAARSRARR
jgi:UDP-N-acetylglucosamine 1-carboxyvinyltransferase